MYVQQQFAPQGGGQAVSQSVAPKVLPTNKISAVMLRVQSESEHVNTQLAARCLDVVLLMFLLPVLLVAGSLRVVQAWWLTGHVFSHSTRIGYQGQSFQFLRFAGPLPGRQWAVFINILRGDMALIGPRPLTYKQATTVPLHRAERFSLRPGLISPHGLQRKVGISHISEQEVDYGALLTLSWRKRLGLLCRAILVNLLKGSADWPKPTHLKFFGVTVTNTTLEEALDWIVTKARAKTPALLAFVNPHCLNIAYRHGTYRQVLRVAGRVLPDGIGIALGCRLQRVGLAANLNGTDLFPHLCERAMRENLSLFLLGGQPGVADAAAQNMQARYPNLQVAGVHDGYFAEQDESEVIAAINQSGADILLVAMGVPTQELWLAKHHDRLTVPVRMGVGGLFDFYSGRISRAPLWLREIGLEWTWRLLQEPGRMWRRYLIGNPLFMFRVWRESRNSLQHELSQRYRRSLTLRNSRYHVQRFLWSVQLQRQPTAKRTTDVLISGLAMLVLAPIFAAVALAIKLDSPGPVFYQQTRVGRQGRLFKMWKLRSMTVDAEAHKAELATQNEMTGGVIFKLKRDPRITCVGRLIRRVSIDELPQLWNVFKGDMSLVGPRPPVPSEVAEYSLADRRRLAVEPGITCLWQVSGRSLLPFTKQVELDVVYIENQSWWWDLKILFQTVPAVLSGRGAF